MGEMVQTVLKATEERFKSDLQEVLNAAKDVALFNAVEWKKSYADMDKNRLEWLALLILMTWPMTMIRYFERYYYQPLIDFISGWKQSQPVLAKVR
jgi:hypothetical protein